VGSSSRCAAAAFSAAADAIIASAVAKSSRSLAFGAGVPTTFQVLFFDFRNSAEPEVMVRGLPSSSFPVAVVVDQPNASSSAIMRPLDEGVFRLRFLLEEEGSAVRYLEARYEDSDMLIK
jgi:hypothetical protein